MPFGRQRGRRSEALRWRLEAAVAVSSRHVRRLTRLGPGVGERSHMVGTALYIAWTIMCFIRHGRSFTLFAVSVCGSVRLLRALLWETHRHNFFFAKWFRFRMRTQDTRTCAINKELDSRGTPDTARGPPVVI